MEATLDARCKRCKIRFYLVIMKRSLLLSVALSTILALQYLSSLPSTSLPKAVCSFLLPWFSSTHCKNIKCWTAILPSGYNTESVLVISSLYIYIYWEKIVVQKTLKIPRHFLCGFSFFIVNFGVFPRSREGTVTALVRGWGDWNESIVRREGSVV